MPPGDTPGERRRCAAIELEGCCRHSGSQKDGAGQQRQRYARHDVGDVVLFREQRREGHECSAGEGDHAELSVHAPDCERRYERVRDVQRRKTIVRRIRSIQRTQPPDAESLTAVTRRSRCHGRVHDEKAHVRHDPDQEVRVDRTAQQIVMPHDEHRERNQEEIQRAVDDGPNRHERERAIERELRRVAGGRRKELRNEDVQRHQAQQDHERPRHAVRLDQ
jgi:hypothetical protein